MSDVVPKRRGRPPKVQPEPVIVEAHEAEGPILPPVEEEAPYRPHKVPYRQLAEELCDWIIAATEAHPREGRYQVCRAAMDYALKLLPQRYVKQTKRADAA